MKLYKLLQTALLLWTMLFAFCGVMLAQKKTGAEKPNIIYVLADQWRAQALGYANDPNVKTPHLDRLASRSLNLVNAVSVLPVCTPYRSALLTGRYPTSTGMFLNDLYLPAEELTMAEIYKKAGYNTAYIGKWHLDGHGRQTFIPEDRRQGFNYWKANECSHNYNKSIYYTGNDPAAHYWNGYDAFEQSADAQKYILKSAKEDKPFLLVLAFGGPHFPHDKAPEDYKKLYDPATIQLRPNVGSGWASKAKEEARGYYAHCTAIDSAIGALYNTLNKAGLDHNTIFIFTSDHGEMMGSHDVKPGQKQKPWDESVRVPFLMHYPSATAGKGRVITTPLTTPDILPTLLGMCGISKPSSIEGEDISGILLGKKPVVDRASLIMNMAPFNESFNSDEFRGVRTARYTYVRNLKGPWLFFDNEKDPYQLNNLVGSPAHRNIQLDLDQKLSGQLHLIGDDFQPGNVYIKKWGYLVDDEGAIGFRNKQDLVQSPKKLNQGIIKK